MRWEVHLISVPRRPGPSRPTLAGWEARRLRAAARVDSAYATRRLTTDFALESCTISLRFGCQTFAAHSRPGIVGSAIRITAELFPRGPRWIRTSAIPERPPVSLPRLASPGSTARLASPKIGGRVAADIHPPRPGLHGSLTVQRKRLAPCTAVASLPVGSLRASVPRQVVMSFASGPSTHPVRVGMVALRTCHVTPSRWGRTAYLERGVLGFCAQNPYFAALPQDPLYW